MLKFLYHKRFIIFLASFILLLFGDIFITPSVSTEAGIVLLLQNLACSSLLFITRPTLEKTVILVIILLAIGFTVVNYFVELNFKFGFPVLYFAYFLLVSYRIFVDISKQKHVGIDTIAAVFCGFILIGVVASMIFNSVDVSNTAFQGVDNTDFSDYFYFSFVTLLTIGYGDVTPTSEVSERLVILFGLIGHFYSLFVIAIIVGKYLKGPSD